MALFGKGRDRPEFKELDESARNNGAFQIFVLVCVALAAVSAVVAIASSIF